MAQKAQAEFAKSWICIPYYPWLSMAKLYCCPGLHIILVKNCALQSGVFRGVQRSAGISCVSRPFFSLRRAGSLAAPTPLPP